MGTGVAGTIQVVLPGKVEPTGLEVRTVPVPRPGPGQVVLRMEATGVSFAEQQMRLGTYYDQPPFPFVPGYDVVGVATALGDGVGDGVEPTIGTAAIGRRFAAVTKIGAWAGHVVVEADDLVAVPDGVSPAAASTVLVNGATAWQMLHRTAQVRAGGTIVVLGANGGVGTTLVQLARDAGVTVIGTSSAVHHDRVRALGATPVDRRDPHLYDRIRALAPDGVDAVFDHVGGPGLGASWSLLRRGGTLVSYGTAAAKGTGGTITMLRLMARLQAWNLAPNGRHAHFYNFWAGKARRPDAFRARLREDLTQVLHLVAEGRLTPQIAATFPLSRVAAAMELAESHTVVGKVVLAP
jgi:NADPH2:quinone reductase